MSKLDRNDFTPKHEILAHEIRILHQECHALHRYGWLIWTFMYPNIHPCQFSYKMMNIHEADHFYTGSINLKANSRMIWRCSFVKEVL